MRLAPEWLVLAGQGPGEALGSDRPGNPRRNREQVRQRGQQRVHGRGFAHMRRAKAALDRIVAAIGDIRDAPGLQAKTNLRAFAIR